MAPWTREPETKVPKKSEEPYGLVTSFAGWKRSEYLVLSPWNKWLTKFLWDLKSKPWENQRTSRSNGTILPHVTYDDQWKLIKTRLKPETRQGYVQNNELQKIDRRRQEPKKNNSRYPWKLQRKKVRRTRISTNPRKEVETTKSHQKEKARLSARKTENNTIK